MFWDIHKFSLPLKAQRSPHIVSTDNPNTTYITTCRYLQTT